MSNGAKHAFKAKTWLITLRLDVDDVMFVKHDPIAADVRFGGVCWRCVRLAGA